jgi:hypothetical protein
VRPKFFSVPHAIYIAGYVIIGYQDQEIKDQCGKFRLGKNSLISGIDRNRCQNRKVSIVSIVLSILSQYLPKAIAILTPPSDIPNDHMIHSLI